MAKSNRERIGGVLDQVGPELAIYVEQELRDVYGEAWNIHLADGHTSSDGTPKLDTQRCISTILKEWETAFEMVLEKDVRSLVHDVRKWRNKHAHEEPFTFDDTLSALISMQKLLEAIKSAAAEEVEKIKIDFMRQQFEGEAKKEQRKAVSVPLAGLEATGLKPWREIVTPHDDVAKGTFQQAEFAADLWQVYKGEGSDEYRQPVAFYGRTYVTEGLRELLANALRRLTGAGGDPVVELQINFGGGKTHSMLALYHLFGGQARASQLPGIEDVLTTTGVKEAPTVSRAVIVGTALRPGSPLTKDDGTVVKTLWGEIAWQLAGRKGYEIVRQADETATNPGDLLDEVFKLAGASLILIDEWVAYARQLFDRHNMLPAGDFDTQFTFAQTLCEAARRAKNVLVCVSIPASLAQDGSYVTTGQAGDQAGQAALNRLMDAVGRSNMVWRPASIDESFEIVRRRLFQPIPGDLVKSRDAVVNEFMAFYRANANDFPSQARDGEYERRMRAAYPIHPELFDRLYEDWSTLEKFQRTRGVLRLMASVIHSLWKAGDPSALILPAFVPLADPSVQTEVTRYLSDNWSGVIDRDVDGQGSIPWVLDGENPNYGRFSACRRVARTVFIGSAPTKDAATRGIDEKRIKLGCAQPKEAIPTFGDALNKLRQRTTYLYVDGSRYWYNTQASVNREAQDRADRCKPEEVHAEIVRRLRELASGRFRGEFDGMHVATQSADVPDDRSLRLVVLSAQHGHKQGKSDSPAIQAAIDVLTYRGSAPRSYRNRLVFVAADEARLPELEREVRQFLAWSSIVRDINSDKLDTDKANRMQAGTSATDADRATGIKLGEVFQWVLVPFQDDPRKDVQWETLKVAGQAEALAVRVIKKLDPEHITRKLGGAVLRRDIDRVPLWREGGVVSVEQLVEDFARFTYLPRLISDQVLFDAMREAVNTLDGLAYADSYEEGEFERLRTGMLLEGGKPLSGVLVKPEIANPLIDALLAAAEGEGKPATKGDGADMENFWGSGATKTSNGAARPKGANTRFHGSIRLDPSTLTSKAGEVSREVVQNLAKLLGSEVEVVIEIHAENADGFPDDVTRVILENCRTLKFETFEFEEE